MKKLNKVAVALILTIFISSCKDDFLDRLPETDVSPENFFNSAADLDMYIYKLYDFPGWEVYMDDKATDNASTTGNVEIKNMMLGTPSSSTITSGWDWDQLRSVNYFLEHFRKAKLNQEQQDHYEGLARFFRARFYFEKVKRYSDVPWYDKPISLGDKELLLKARDPRAFVVDKIMEDFDFAASHVLTDSKKGAVNRWIVKAYQARFALYEGTFRRYHSELQLQNTAERFLQKARNVAKDIMDNGKFAIYNTKHPDQDYLSLFNSPDLSSNPEIIHAVYSQSGLRNSGWWEASFGNYEVSPAKDLLQDYLMRDGSFYTSQPGYQTFSFVKEFENRDPRLSQTYAYPGFVLNNVDTYSQGGGLYVQQLGKNFSGYHQIKGFVNDPNYDVQMNLDVPVIRFAEVLLIYAEARAELGELTQADLDLTVNLLRDRVGMSAHLSLNPTLDPIEAARYPDVTSSSRAVILEIRRERRIELALEGFRFDDLMRWHAGKLLEKEQEGIYFSGTGKFDMTGDGIPDMMLLNASETIPENKEKNELGQTLLYYRVGNIGQSVSVFLKNGNSGTVQTTSDNGNFTEPKYYYRPIPQTQVNLSEGNLKQIFGW